MGHYHPDAAEWVGDERLVDDVITAAEAIGQDVVDGSDTDTVSGLKDNFEAADCTINAPIFETILVLQTFQSSRYYRCSPCQAFCYCRLCHIECYLDVLQIRIHG